MSDRTAKLKNRLIRDWPKGQQLIRTLGPGPAGALFDIVLAGGMVTLQIADSKKSDGDVLKIVDLFLDREIENTVRTGGALGSLASRLGAGDLAPIARQNAMNAASYGALPGDSETMKAARWVANASTTARGKGGSITETNNIITMAVAASTPMTVLDGIDYINKLLLEQGGRSEARGPLIAPPSQLPSSPGGRRLLEIAMQYLGGRTPGGASCAWEDLACYLLGAVIGCHGFPDANGRTGRVLYSICWIRGGSPFIGISPAGEQQLTRLP